MPAEKRNLGEGARLTPSAFKGKQAGSREGIPMAVTQLEVVAGAALTAASAESNVRRICFWLGMEA